MKLNIEINSNNDICLDPCETVRILKRLVNEIMYLTIQGMVEDEKIDLPIKDLNGNTVGHITWILGETE